ncbi:MAG: hypothetical protein HOY71_49180 [Nonomuraea sp.]|nr:hypothetical protein [Nonomuraea sp.]
MAAAAGCSGGGGWKPPAKGQASVLLTSRDAGDPTSLGQGGDVNAMAIGDSGDVSLLVSGIYTVSPPHKVTKLKSISPDGSGGMVALPGGAFAVGAFGAVHKVDAHGTVSVLAGVDHSGSTRHPSVPKSAAAASYRFSGVATPFGVRPDGSLLVSDREAVWALAGGTLTRLYQFPPDRTSSDTDNLVRTWNTVDGAGNVYVVSGNGLLSGNVRDITVVRPDGTATPLALPARQAGLSGLSSMEIQGMAGGDAESVYINVRDPSDQYVLRVGRGIVNVVARHHLDGHDYGQDCKKSQPMDAHKLPCPLPETIAYRGGKLVMGGREHYLLELAL